MRIRRNDRAGIAFAIVAVALIAIPSVAARRTRIAWRGTVSAADGSTGTFVARTRLFPGPPNGEGSSDYEGRFRCRGRGCPLHRGKIVFAPSIAANRIAQIYFRGRRGTVQCLYDDALAAPPDLAIDGTYRCRVGLDVVAEGSIRLTATRR